MSTAESILRKIPSVDRILQEGAVENLLGAYPRATVREGIQAILDGLRNEITTGGLEESKLEERIERLPDVLRCTLEANFAPSLRRLINATGVLIHTNAGRAPIAPHVAHAMAELASGYSNLEYDLEQGRRGHRDLHFETRMTRLLECEAATVCNNNAAALFLVLNTLGRGKKVVVSRGELVEIGGSFRIPSIMERSGAILKEVGTTNKTRLSDYREAIDEQTALILRVHPSNYRIVGFTHQPALEHLVDLSRKTGVPLLKDAGSGLLFPSPHPFLKREPSIQTALRLGVDLVCFSGDKLLGGPQSGIVVGKKQLVDRLRRNPLMRVLRVDKATYAALERTLIEYERGVYEKTIPIHRMLSTSVEELLSRAEVLRRRLGEAGVAAEVVAGNSLSGGGSAPEEPISTRLLAVGRAGMSANELERKLRDHRPPILARIEEERLLFDLRTVAPADDGIIAEALIDICGREDR